MAVGDRIKVALETDVAVVQAEVDAGALEIQAINNVIDDTDSGNAALKVDVDDHETRITILETDEGIGSVTAKSVVFDFENNHGSTAYTGIRSIDFYKDGELIVMTSALCTAYATNSYYSGVFEPILAFITSLSKVGSFVNTSWETDSGYTSDLRLIVVFGSEQEFDEIVINNLHSDGGQTTRGVKDTKVYASADSITDVTYGSAVPNSEIIFDGVFNQHVSSNIIDNQSIPVVGAPSAITDRLDALETSVTNIEQVVSDGGIIGRTTEAPTGYVGETIIKQESGTLTLAGGTEYSHSAVTLTPGTWIVNGMMNCNDSSIVLGYKWFKVDYVGGFNYFNFTALMPNYGEADYGMIAPSYHITVTEDTVFKCYIKVETSATASYYFKTSATRIA